MKFRPDAQLQPNRRELPQRVTDPRRNHLIAPWYASRKIRSAPSFGLVEDGFLEHSLKAREVAFNSGGARADDFLARLVNVSGRPLPVRSNISLRTAANVERGLPPRMEPIRMCHQTLRLFPHLRAMAER